MNYSFLLVLACVMLVVAPFLLYVAAREGRRRRARERSAAITCGCDLATCPRSQVCRMLGEYRITYRVIEER